MSLVNSFPGGNGGGSGLPSGGTTGQMLVKHSNTDGDAKWVNPVSTSDCYKTGDTAETALADNDKIPFYDTSASGKRSSTWSNIKSVLKTYFDTLYSTVKTKGTPTSGGTDLSLVTTGDMYNWNNPSIPVVANQFDKANIYSTTEKIVGCWIDGRPVYQKTIQCTMPQATTDGTEVVGRTATGISINECVKYDTYLKASNFRDGNYVFGDSATKRLRTEIKNNNGSWDIEFRNAYVSANTWVPYVTIYYTKTTDAANSFKYADENDYSTTEHIVGSWIDGKPVYQKSFSFNVNNDNSWKIVSIGASVDTVIKYFGGILKDSGTYTSLTSIGNIPIPTDFDGGLALCNVTTNSHSSTPNSVVIRVGNGLLSSLCHITIQYTKTTD